MTNTKLRKKYRKELVEFLRRNGFNCEYKGKWYCWHPNEYDVIIDRKGILFRWQWEKTGDEFGEFIDTWGTINSYVREIIDNSDFDLDHSDIVMFFTRYIPWELLEENEEEFREEIEKLKELIRNVKDYRIYFTVDIRFHVERR